MIISLAWLTHDSQMNPFSPEIRIDTSLRERPQNEQRSIVVLFFNVLSVNVLKTK